MWEIIGKIADVASLVSLVVSGYAAWQITAVKRKIGRRAAFNARSGSIITRVRETADWMSGNLENFPNNEVEFKKKFRPCLALLERNKSQFDLVARKSLAKMIGLDDDYDKISARALAVEPENRSRFDPDKNRLFVDIMTELSIFCDLADDMISERQIGGTDDE